MTLNEKLREYQSWQVTLLTTQRVTYVVDARTPEQAEDLAEELFETGEQPQELISTDTEIEEVVPVDSLTSDEVFSDGTGHF
jgi:hypothetical protein